MTHASLGFIGAFVVVLFLAILVTTGVVFHHEVGQVDCRYLKPVPGHAGTLACSRTP